MRNVALGLLISVALLPATSARAGDTQPDDEAAIYGNLHLGVYDDVFVNTNPLMDQLGLSGGGKVAIEPSEFPIGLQFDVEDKYSNASLQSGATANQGSEYDALVVAHGTFEANDQLKLGVFAGYENINQNLTSISSPTYNFHGVTNLSRGASHQTYISIGGEALYAFTDDNWAQLRVGFVKPTSATLDITDRTTNVSASATADVSQFKGYEVGVGARFGLFDQFSLRADANFTSIQNATGATANDLNTLITGQYIFADSPFSIYSQIGYNRLYDATASEDTLYTRGGVTWSFGGPSNTTKNKLFRSAGFGGVFN
jgi:hypothetical protein